MNTPKRPHGVRKHPVQPRSTARNARILNACGELLDDIGYDAVTTTLIAQHARVSIGSIYQYFTDKKGVMAALAARHLKVLLDNTSAAFDTKLGRPEPERASDVIAAFCDETIDSYRNEHGCRSLRFGAAIPDHDGPHAHDTITSHLLSLMPPNTTHDRIGIQLATETTLALIDAAFRHGDQGDELILNATRTLSIQLLNTYPP